MKKLLVTILSIAVIAVMMFFMGYKIGQNMTEKRLTEIAESNPPIGKTCEIKYRDDAGQSNRLESVTIMKITKEWIVVQGAYADSFWVNKSSILSIKYEN